MLPEAPGLFSTMMVVPSRCCSPGCTMRAIGSTVPPGGNGTTILVMLPGAGLGEGGVRERRGGRAEHERASG